MVAVTVLGASGRTGSQVVRLLTRRGHRVLAGTRNRRRFAASRVSEPTR